MKASELRDLDEQLLASRRRALLLIKEAFQQHGIGFALPTVQVSGEGSEGAAAQSALALVKAAEATAAE